MPNFFKPGRAHRPEGQIFAGIAVALAFIGLVAGTIQLVLTKTDVGSYLSSLLEVVL